MEIFGILFDQYTLLIFSFLILSGLMQLFFLLFFYLRVPLLGRKTIKNQGVDVPGGSLPVSVVVCARNNAEDLVQLLPDLFAQNYPAFEVVVVDNCSEDATEDLLADLRLRYPELKTTYIKNEAWFLDPKQFARMVGVKAARYEWILFMDPLARPETQEWLASMSASFTAKGSFVLGYFSYVYRPGFVNAFIRYDSLCSYLNYFGCALTFTPFSGDVRNMAVRKSLFHNEEAFRRYANIHSEYVPLFLNGVASKSNTSVCVHSAARVLSPQPEVIRDWFATRKNVAYLSRYITSSGRVIKAIEPVTRVLFFVSFALSMYTPFWPFVLGFFALRTFILWGVWGWTQRFFGEQKLFGWIVLFDFLMPFFYLYIIVANLFTIRRVRYNL